MRLPRRPQKAGLLVMTLFLFAVIVISITPSFSIEIERYYSAKLGREVEVAKGELIVKFKPATRQSQRVAFLTKTQSSYKTQLTRIDAQVIKLPYGQSVQSALEELQNSSDVVYVQPNYIRRAQVVPNDTEFSQQWGITKIGVDFAWEKTTGKNSIVVAVLDTGVDYTHPDLQLNVDSSTGYNFIDDNTDSMDDNGHGTHVAGIIGATTNNSEGTSGVAGGWYPTKGVKIMPIKVLDAEGGNNAAHGDAASLIRGITYAADHGARIINMSLGGPDGIIGDADNDAVNYAANKGCILVAASGNDGTNLVMYPAAYPRVIAVGAVTQTNQHSVFSNYGTRIDFVAPGEDILSTWPLSIPKEGTQPGPAGYDYLQGTSMATPFLSGVFALLLSKNPSLSSTDAEDILKVMATDLGTPGKDIYYGYGLINAADLNTSLPITVTAKNAPNPFNPTLGQPTRLFVPNTIRGTSLKVRIYNLAGEKVHDGESSIKSLYDWNGKNNDGYTVADGIYIYVVETDKGKATGKLTVSRAHENY